MGNPRPVEPFYSILSLHEPVLLYEGPFTLVEGESHQEFVGQVGFEWLPRPHVAYDGVGHDQQTAIAHLFDPQLHVTSAIVIPYMEDVPSQIATPQMDVETMSYVIRSSGSVGRVEAGHKDSFSEVVFNLVNFMSLQRGKRVDVGSETSLQTSIELGEWRLVVQNVPQASRVVKDLHDSGGYAFTNHCKLARQDGGEFSWLDIDDVLEVVFLAFSFARGALVGPALFVGKDRHGIARGAAWTIYAVDRWRSRTTWLPPLEPGSLEQTVSLFHHRWGSKFWQQVLRRAVRMYVDANSPEPIDTAIVTAQMGLELLAWSVLYEDQGWLDDRDGRLNAAGKLRLLLRWAGVGTALPPELETLCRRAAGQGWDGPAAVVGVRNLLVHPRQSDLSFESDLLVDAWKLASQYLALALLRIIGYRGNYVDRLDARYYSDSTRVPWVPQENPAVEPSADL